MSISDDGRHGWQLFAHPLFLDQFEKLATVVTRLREKDPYGWRKSPNTKLLEALRQLVFEIIPQDPTRPEYRQGGTLGNDRKHWFRAKFGGGRFRLFFRYSTSAKVIVFAWVNDETTLRTYGSRSDAYAVFRKMLDKGNPPDDWTTLLVAASKSKARERLESIEIPSFTEAPPEIETMKQTLPRKALALRTDTKWVPGETEIQRGREIMLEAFEQPHNLPLPDFALLANKSHQQIYKDIKARRLLALNMGGRDQKLPDWQLDPVKQRLTQVVLKGATEVDTWTLYHALLEPLEGLAGRSPVEAVTAETVDVVAKAVFNVLGAH